MQCIQIKNYSGLGRHDDGMPTDSERGGLPFGALDDAKQRVVQPQRLKLSFVNSVTRSYEVLTKTARVRTSLGKTL